MADSLITKRAIADSLKELAKTKSFNKISVRDIAEKCSINRQTFYYHFTDKYQLLEWIYFNDYIANGLDGLDVTNWVEKLEACLTVMQQDKSFCINTIRHTDNYLQNYLAKVAQDVFKSAIDELDNSENPSEESHIYFSKFFGYGLSGILIEWMGNGMEESPEHVSRYFRQMLRASLSASKDSNLRKI